MNFNFINFFGQVQKEALKVSWATRKEVLSSTLMVVIVVLVASVFFLFADMLIYNIVQYCLEFGR